jgi:hypothetical protein
VEEIPSRTVAALGAAVTEELDPTYTLVCAEFDLPEDVVTALVRGENPWETKGGDRLTVLADDLAYPTACQAVDQLAADIVSRWEREDEADYTSLLEVDWAAGDERRSAIDTVRDRDQPTWFDDMVNRHGKVLLRVGIAAMDEDASLSYEPLPPQRFLDLLGFEHTAQNLKRAADLVNNAAPEYSTVIGYAMLGVDLADFLSMPTDADRTVELHNPHVWLGDPFNGGGWCSEEPFAGTLTVRRGDLRTDKGAFGYSWDEVVGGADAECFASGSLTVVDEQRD